MKLLIGALALVAWMCVCAQSASAQTRLDSHAHRAASRVLRIDLGSDGVIIGRRQVASAFYLLQRSELAYVPRDTRTRFIREIVRTVARREF
ncbi:MAG: hypothetical protein IPK60_03025 [Sandaracinaceae bacterium]|jgi:hypothetical protein|nr:hypothetical protein [Sandaracinaceae bacterium]